MGLEEQIHGCFDFRLLTKTSLKHLHGRSIAVVVQATAPQRIFAVNVNIAGRQVSLQIRKLHSDFEETKMRWSSG